MTADDRGPELAAVLGLFLGLSWVFVSLRIYVKAFLSKNWGADDLLLVISLIFFSAYCACSATGVHFGTGRHVQDIPEQDIPKALYYWFLCEIFYAITTLFIRLSIAVFLLRICVKPTHKHIVYSTVAMVTIFTIFYFFLVLFQCRPVSYFWGQYEGMKGSCIDPAVVPNASIAHSAVSFAADWVLGLLPVVLIWDLKMNRRTKVSVGILLSLGLLAGVATMIRVPFIKVLALTDDFLYATTDVAIWSTVEAGLGLTAAAGATLRPLFRKFYNLSSRGTRQTRTTHPRDSRMIDLHPTPSSINIKSKLTSASPSPSSSSTNHLEIYLRPDAGEVMTNIRSPFGDSREDVDRNGGGKGKHGGIKVHRTVEVSRVGQEGDESDGASETRPGTGKSFWDIV